ncbi:O-antigen ligase family protein [Candidatus Marinimicrobia bacterium]|nr:O-antigen ligase family protein [Candidatus Neomarinimicrobiota bacterium]
MYQNNLLKKILDGMNILAVFFYSIVLVVFVNNPRLTYIENYFGYLVLVVFILQALIVYKKIYIPKIYLGFLLFLVSSVFLLIVNYNDSSYKLLISLIQIYIFSIIVYNMLIYNNSSIPIELGLVLGLMYSIYIGYFIGRDFFTGSMVQRFSGTLANPNHYSFMLTVALLLLTRRFLLYRHGNRTKKILNFLILFLIFIFSYEVIFYAISRQGVLLVLLLFGYLFFQLFKSSDTLGRMFLIMLGFILILFTWFTIKDVPLVYNRIGSLFSWFGRNSEFEIDNSIYYRFSYMIDAYNIWLDKPIFGFGLHQFKYVNQSGVSHNNFFEILVNNGIVGFALYYVLYIYIYISYFKIRLFNNIDSNWILTVIIMLFIADMTVLTYIEKPNWLIFSIVLFIINKYDNKNNFIIKL